MPKRVLSVGQCMPDTAAIRRFLEKHFQIEFATAVAAEDALEALRTNAFDLVLVNRKLDVDYSDGVEVLKRIKGDPQTAGVPVMVVSNYPDAHTEAVAHGGVPGFGKTELSSVQAVEKVRPYLE